LICHVVDLHQDLIKTYGRNNQKAETGFMDDCPDGNCSGGHPFIFDYYKFLSNRLYYKLNTNQ